MAEQAVMEPKRGPGRPPTGIPEFTVEFGTKKNNGIITIACLDKLRVRGAWPKVNVGLSGRLPESMGSMPDIPGAYMTINVSKGHALVFDPTHREFRKQYKFEKFWEEFNSYKELATSSAMFKDPNTYGPFPKTPFILGPDDIKTLLLEILRMAEIRPMGGNKMSKIDSAMLRVVEGKLPTLKQVEELPGRQLLDPGSAFRHPRYAHEYDAWRDKIDQSTEV